jgi:hypothetical protein
MPEAWRSVVFFTAFVVFPFSPAPGRYERCQPDRPGGAELEEAPAADGQVPGFSGVGLSALGVVVHRDPSSGRRPPV